MFPGSRNVRVSGGTFNSQTVMYTRTGDAGFQQLKEAVASSAFHNSDERFDPPRCHPGTRIAVMQKIMAWVCTARNAGDHQPAQKLILWLNGKAGAGKSAIAQSIAEACEAAGLLVASFFFCRTDTARNNGRALVPTLAYQMASVFPETRPRLEEIITRDPLIFRRSLRAQMASLIIKPMMFLTHIPAPRLIIIDGLSECKDAKVQENLLNVIIDTLREHRLPLIFLIASRPEPHIADVFNSFKSTGVHITLELNDSFDPGADIRLFLEDAFNEIKMGIHFSPCHCRVIAVQPCIAVQEHKVAVHCRALPCNNKFTLGVTVHSNALPCTYRASVV